MKITIYKSGTAPEIFGEHLDVVNSLLDIGAKTFGVDIEIEEDLPEDTPEENELYIVNLQKFNIVPGKLFKDSDGHYNDEQYRIAYNNGLGVQSAMVYAKENGYKGCLMPNNIYSFTYKKAEVKQDIYTKGVIYLLSDQVLDLNGSTFQVIYDSTKKSPYHTAPESEAWKLEGWLIATQNTINAEITNGTLKGDVYERSFNDGGTGFNSENGREQTSGISISTNSYGVDINNLDISGFMGDGVRMVTRGFSYAHNYFITPKIIEMTKGYYNPDGSLTITEGSFYTNEILKIDRSQLATKCPLYPNQLQLQTGGGYTRIPKFGGQQFVEVVFFDSNNVFISKQTIQYLDIFTLPENAVGIRLQLKDIDSNIFVHPHIAFTQVASRDVIVSHCDIHDNHRGGISNCADNTIIEFNNIENNGMDCGIGAPIFPDSTRYAINCEDHVSNNVIIRYNTIKRGFAGIGVGCYKMEIYDNEFENIGGVSVYNNLSTIIRNNIFRNSGQIGIRKGTISADILFDNNTVINDSNTTFSITAVDGTSTALFTNNNITGKNIQIQRSEDVKILFNDNILNSDLLVGKLNYIAQNINVDEFFRNTVTWINEDNYLKLSLFYKSGGFNKFINVDFASKANLGTVINFTNEEFTECHINPIVTPSKVGEYLVDISNSKFNDCLISPFNGYIKNPTKIEVSKLTLNNCEINIKGKQTFVAKSYPNTIDYEVKLIGCEINYLEENHPLLVATTSPITEIKII
ncbi:MAG TPA: right-handed parallel beta-helix repeat-containing protein [Allosphingosinicella sp.]|jgi:hypothetical protein